MFSVRFFLRACFLWDTVKWKTNRLLKESQNYSLMLLELKQSQIKTATTMAPNKRLHMPARFNFLDIYSLLYAKNKNVIIRSSRFWEHKYLARTKFKLIWLIGKFKVLRKLKHQKAFPARSPSFFCTFIPFVRKATRKLILKNSRIWDETQTLGHQISNSKRARTTFKLKGKSVKMLRTFKQ